MKLSIIVPVYNTAEYLPACLDSIIYPELEDYEIIIVNDGSTDSSLQVAQSYVKKFSSLVRLINKENGGLGDARNAGIEPAKGDFLLFLDSDDKLMPNAVPEIMEELTDDRDMIFYDIQPFTPEGVMLEIMPGCKRSGKVNLTSYPELLMEYPSACNKVCRRELFIKTGIRFPTRVWYEDLRTMPKLYLHTDRIYSSCKSRYLYLMRPGSITNNARLDRHLEIVDAVDDLIAYFKSMGKYEQYKSELDYTAFYNMFLTASVRVCDVDTKSPVLRNLKASFISRFPDFKTNPHIKYMAKKHRLLSFLLMAEKYSAVSAIMKLNNYIKRK